MTSRLWFVVVAGCGRVAFDPVSGSLPGDAVADRASGDAGAACFANPSLGASGCVSRPPIDLWMFAGAGQNIPDTSGQACSPLSNTALASGPGLDVSSGGVGTAPGGLATTFARLATAGKVSLEVWVQTSDVPAAEEPIIDIRDVVVSRVHVADVPTGSYGQIESAQVTVQSSLEAVATGAPAQLAITFDGANMQYFVNGGGAGFATSSSVTWDQATSQLELGPWQGVVIRAAIWDVGLTPSELTCLRTAGPSTVP